MLGPFFRLAMLSVSRHSAFRRALVVHLGVAAAAVWLVYVQKAFGLVMLGQFLLVAGIVEGAILVGWRLTQLPKSQALEFLLVSPLQPRSAFLAEALVGLGRLALVTLAGLPVLIAATFSPDAPLGYEDYLFLLLMPFTWGAITGLGLTTWAYEPLKVRRWAELFLMAMIVLYLVVGVLAIDRLDDWLAWLPREGQDLVRGTVIGFHTYNPFAIMQFWMETKHNRGLFRGGDPLDRMLALEVVAMLTVVLLLARAASRLKGHFHERHYRPAIDPKDSNRGQIGDRPLSWWAVKRVTEYSGRVNLWLAGGFTIIYAAYTMAGTRWPPWMGRRVFEIVDIAGGIPGLATGLVVLAAVPAAFQYGLWDSNAQDRCRRLELLLLTDLSAEDYWRAAAAAAWRRGRGYFLLAVVLWVAGVVSGKLDVLQLTASLSAGLILWGLYFALGFRAFSRGHQANGLGSLLTLGLPLLAWSLNRAEQPLLASLVPPGMVYQAAVLAPTVGWLPGPLLALALALLLSRQALAHCDPELRLWYEQHHGQQQLD